jgi:hypothetical protein
VPKPRDYQIDFVEDQPIEAKLIKVRQKPYLIESDRARTLEGIECSFKTLEVVDSTKDLVRKIVNNDPELNILDLANIKFLSLAPSDTRARFGVVLSQALEFNNNLQRIHLGNNHFGPDVGMEIINALDLSNNETLTNLNILGTNIVKADAAKIIDDLINNNTLKSFQFNKGLFSKLQSKIILDIMLTNGKIEEEVEMKNDDILDSTKSQTSSRSQESETSSPSPTPSSNNLVKVKDSSGCCIIS